MASAAPLQRAPTTAPPAKRARPLRGASGSPQSDAAPVAAQRAPANAILPKLTVSTPNDPLELEADRIADQVMRMPAPAPVGGTPSPVRDAIVQRKCGACEEEDLHRKADRAGAPAVGPDFRAGLAAARASGGRPLSPVVRAYMEPRFGRDFAGVRVHTDARASKLAESVNAEAFAIGTNLFFRQPHHADFSAHNKRLLAHELAHVTQQGRSAKSSPSLLHRQEAKSRPVAAAPVLAPQGTEASIDFEAIPLPEVRQNLSCVLLDLGGFLWRGDYSVLFPANASGVWESGFILNLLADEFSAEYTESGRAAYRYSGPALDVPSDGLFPPFASQLDLEHGLFNPDANYVVEQSIENFSPRFTDSLGARIRKRRASPNDWLERVQFKKTFRTFVATRSPSGNVYVHLASKPFSLTFDANFDLEISPGLGTFLKVRGQPTTTIGDANPLSRTQSGAILSGASANERSLQQILKTNAACESIV